jgi:soluble lytic murein transglycosylase-like protein
MCGFKRLFRAWFGAKIWALVVFCSFLWLGSTVRADIYRFTDEAGIEHYTNIKPTGRRWQVVIRTRSPGRGGASSPRRDLQTDPYRHIRYDAFIREAALLYQLPESFVRAVLRVESNFYPDAVSCDGAIGLMQLMPFTASAMGVRDPFDPRENIFGGARFLRVLANTFDGDLVLTVAAYNAGQNAVTKYGGVPPYAETQQYVQNVLRYYYAYTTTAQ